MPKINLPIDPELGKVIKGYVDQGYTLQELGVLKGLGSVADSFFICLDTTVIKPKDAPAETIGAQTILPPPGHKLKDGEAEKIEASIPMPAKTVVVGVSTDPNRPTIAQVVDKILSDHKAAGLSGGELVKKCVDDIMILPYEPQVLNACQAYLNTII